MARLSIVVPVYKAEKYIDGCIQSILNQTYKDFILILVNDGTPDNSGVICDKYASLDDRVRVIHKENGGQSSARNAGLDMVDTELVTFVDSDDEIDVTMYEKMIGFFDKNNLDIVCCDTYLVRGRTKKFRPIYDEDKLFFARKALEEVLSGHIDNAVWNKIYKASLFDDIRFPVGRIYEDVATVYRIFSKAANAGYMKQPYYYYYRRSGSTIAGSFNSKGRYDCFLGYKERLEFAEKNCTAAVPSCHSELIKVAVATMTAFLANGESNDSQRFLEVEKALNYYYENPGDFTIKGKTRVLLWGFNNCRMINSVYARCSRLIKLLRA